MSDLIRRQDAIEAVAQQWLFEASVESPYVNDDDIDEYRQLAGELFKDVPSARPTDIANAYTNGYVEGAVNEALKARPQWIPCSERLPENNGCMLVTIDDAIEFGKYEDGEWSIWVCEHWDKWDAKGVTAWMPLPEPYKGGDDDELD